MFKQIKTGKGALSLLLIIAIALSSFAYDAGRTYAEETFSFAQTPTSFKIGETFQYTIVGNITGLSITWALWMGNGIATISSTGLLTAIGSGGAIVVATITGPSVNQMLMATFSVTEGVDDGIYRIIHPSTSMCLELLNQCILDNTDVVQMYLHGTPFPEIYQVGQLWKVNYLGAGEYIIRPYQRLNAALKNDNGNAKIALCYSNTSASVPGAFKWHIFKESNNQYTISNMVVD